jgi:UDP-N-acetylglucosamine acyltransferase
MGSDNYVGTGCVLGGDPQDHGFHGEETFLRIGSHNTFREYVTVHRATGAGNSTVVGDHNLIMAYTHLGHNVKVGNHVNIANNVGVSGHVTIEDLANLGGMTGVHQYVRIGKVAMLGGMTRTVRDVPPFMTSSGQDQEVHDINAIGLRRIGVSPQERLALHRACKLLYRSQLGLSNAIETVRREVPLTDQVLYLLDFEQRRFKGKSGRGDQP